MSRWIRTNEGRYVALIHGVQYAATRTLRGWRVETVTKGKPQVTGEYALLSAAQARVELFAKMEQWESEASEFIEGWTAAHEHPLATRRPDASSWWCRGFDAARTAIEDGEQNPDRRAAYHAYIGAKNHEGIPHPETK